MEEARGRELIKRIESLKQELLGKLDTAQEEIRVLNADEKKGNIVIAVLLANFNSNNNKEIKDLKTQVSLRDKEISYLETNYNFCKEETSRLKAECKCKLIGEEIKDLNIRIDGIVGACNKLFSKLKETDEKQKKDILELKQQVQENSKYAAASSATAAKIFSTLLYNDALHGKEILELKQLVQKNIEEAAASSSSAAAALRNMTENEREIAILSSLAEGEIDGVHFVMTGSKDAIQGIKSASSDDIQVVIVSKPERFFLRFEHEDGHYCGNSSDRYHFFHLHRNSQRCRGRIVDGVISKEMLKEIKSPGFNLETSQVYSEPGEMPGRKGLKRKADGNISI